MKLKKAELKAEAKKIGTTPMLLLRKVGIGEKAFSPVMKGAGVGSEVVKEMYNRYGREFVMNVVDFEGGTINGFESKYVKSGNKLY